MDSSPRTKAHDRPASASGDPDTSTTKRPSSQSQLLPPLELLSSSPGLPGLPNVPSRRQSRPLSAPKAPSGASNNDYLKYPTPVPTSSTGILSSSPPRVHPQPRLQRAPSTVSERAPLSAVPSVELNENGDTLRMGRSSNSSDYQLSANRLISRVHVKARYVPATVPLQPNKIEIECNGWNGLKLHCQGRTYEMHKGEVLSFETEGVEIMLNVQDARVLLHWPKRDARDGLADLGWEDSPPRSVRNGAPQLGGGSPRLGSGAGLGLLQSSPLHRTTRITSPESPTPAHTSLQHIMSDGVPSNSQHSSILSDLPSISDREKSVEIYEDEDAGEQDMSAKAGSIGDQSFMTDVNNSFSSDLSDVNSDEEDENYPNEENDPIVHSFGPFGANLNSRMAMTSFHVDSPKRRRLGSGGFASPRVNGTRRGSSGPDASNPLLSGKSASTSREASIGHKASHTPTPDSNGHEALMHAEKDKETQPDISHLDVATITNHVVNQLAFSRLSSTPLSTIMANLPAEEKKDLLRHHLKFIVETATCIGTIEREGKDADGKPLESQYYYIPEKDDDEHRRAAVVDGLRKPTLRNCRKHHVQYYWKRPRTP
ncbi:hypothetical protein N8I77_001067 [Diaporthe amygdali]|uniref:FHA domain-containing protein n=1 Tax=Phomopsis amygdali TaxID=1214568 RepID=A0AAD9W9Q1_PHOAM|nr:uncharacterized protein J7T55_004929 [Diaporthe amygdali]KAJ0114685.1 hypothetical protein J7T55_004929 [Diaporthe amygdali]KAK2614221.1 hypothetical protein N8I77_001067 [Diaporthe amygdali]